MARLLQTSPDYSQPCNTAPCHAWSDTAAWDAVALMREASVLGNDRQSITRARAAYRFVQMSRAFSGGACGRIPYQVPQPSDKRVKTLETGANMTKAALLLYGATHDRSYLDQAIQRYAVDRTLFLDPNVPLYTVHLIDDGLQCRQVPHRFFASVNGDMIWNGVRLWQYTGQRHFYDEAPSTAQAVDLDLSDASGVFVDVQGENDVVEPLVEAMYELAVQEHVGFARDWIGATRMQLFRRVRRMVRSRAYLMDRHRPRRRFGNPTVVLHWRLLQRRSIR